jgi:hypothetical protein
MLDEGFADLMMYTDILYHENTYHSDQPYFCSKCYLYSSVLLLSQILWAYLGHWVSSSKVFMFEIPHLCRANSSLATRGEDADNRDISS